MTEGLPYISDASFQIAMRLEEAVSDIPEAVGILGVSVTPTPIPGGKCRRFEVTVLTDRLGSEVAKNRATTEAVLRAVFAKEISNGEVELSLKVFVGRRGSTSNKTGPGLGSSSTEGKPHVI